MSIEVQWTEADPATAEKRFVRVTRFAGKWSFVVRAKRREDWAAVEPTRDQWETLLEALERRMPRREGITEDDLKAVRKTLAGLKPPPEFDGEAG